jgi:hypothetical protein
VQCLPRESVGPWLERSGLGSLYRRGDVAAHLFRVEGANIEKIEAASSMMVARGMSGWLWEHQPDRCLVWVNDHGVWPSSENLHLYYTWRRSLGDGAVLDDAPAHEFLPFEQHELTSLLHMAIIFGWGFLAASSDGRAALRVDDYGQVEGFAPTQEQADDLLARIQ